MSRTDRQRVRATLLGNRSGSVRCPRVLRVGIRFPRYGDPVDWITGFMEQEGYDEPERMRGAFDLPPSGLVARPYGQREGVVNALRAPMRETLWHALVLGLCTAHVYDPTRPVLWTQTSLTRRLELFDAAGFYA